MLWVCVCVREREMREADVLRCQIQEWYPRFRRHSIRTLIHPLPESFVSFLLQDGLFLPRESDAMPSRTRVQNSQLQAEDYSHWDEEDDETDEPEFPSFPGLEAQVRASIETLGGSVFPKLNWSAPKDTPWISPSGSLKCQNFGEISLLLKASDNVVHDLCHAFDSCDDKSTEKPSQVVLALRKWYDLRPEMEFRGFVRGNILVGICQREVTGFYATLLGKEEEIEQAIADFFVENISYEFGGEDYTFDCYVTKDWRIKLLDFNPWGCSTLSLLFSWEDLEGTYTQVLERVQQNHWIDDDKEPEIPIQERKASGKVDVSSDSLSEGLEGVILQETCVQGTLDKTMRTRANLRSFAVSESERETLESPKPPHDTGYLRDDKIWTHSEGGEIVTPSELTATTNNGSGLFESRPESTLETISLQKFASFLHLREEGYRVELRIVKSEGLVQPGLRVGTGVPIDFVNQGAWENIIRRAREEEAREQLRERAVAGG